jgi:hypothetical protein
MVGQSSVLFDRQIAVKSVRMDMACALWGYNEDESVIYLNAASGRVTTAFIAWAGTRQGILPKRSGLQFPYDKRFVLRTASSRNAKQCNSK